MGILSRFKDIMASNINAVFSNKEDKHPEKSIEKYLIQLRSDLGQVKSETAALESDVRRAKAALSENQAEAAKFERYIAKANENGNPSDAAVYENKLAAVRQDGERLQQKFDEVNANYISLSQMNTKLSSDISVLENKLTEIKSRLDAAAAQEKLNHMAEKAGAKNSDEMFDRMKEKADYVLDRANAMAELENPSFVRDFSEVEELAGKYDSMSDPVAPSPSIDSSDDSGDGTIDIF